MEPIVHIVISILALAVVILSTNNKLLREDIEATSELLFYLNYYKRIAENSKMCLVEFSLNGVVTLRLDMPDGGRILAPRHILIALKRAEHVA
jgi:hypothetical protein